MASAGQGKCQSGQVPVRAGAGQRNGSPPSGHIDHGDDDDSRDDGEDADGGASRLPIKKG